MALVWWKKPSYIASIGPLLVAVATLLSLWVSGYFDQERLELKEEVRELNEQIGSLNNVRDSLIEELTVAYSEIKALQTNLDVDTLAERVSHIIGSLRESREIDFSDITEADWETWKSHGYVPRIDSLLKQF